MTLSIFASSIHYVETVRVVARCVHVLFQLEGALSLPIKRIVAYVHWVEKSDDVFFFNFGRVRESCEKCFVLS